MYVIINSIHQSMMMIVKILNTIQKHLKFFFFELTPLYTH